MHLQLCNLNLKRKLFKKFITTVVDIVVAIVCVVVAVVLVVIGLLFFVILVDWVVVATIVV